MRRLGRERSDSWCRRSKLEVPQSWRLAWTRRRRRKFDAAGGTRFRSEFGDVGPQGPRPGDSGSAEHLHVRIRLRSFLLNDISRAEAALP